MAGPEGNQAGAGEDVSARPREAVQTVVVVPERGYGVLALPLALLLFLALFLAYVLWPGNLVYPQQAASMLRAPDIQEFQRSHNEALESEIRTLQVALRGDVCTADAPGGLPGAPAIPQAGQGAAAPVPAPGAGPDGPITPGQPAAATDAPSDPAPEPGGVPVAPDAGAPWQGAQAAAATPAGQSTRVSSAQLLARLDETTVFVVGSKGDGLTTGTGIVVTDRHVLTNLHVVDGVREGRLRVANKHLSRPLSARVVGTSGSFDFGSSDFALLELEEPISVTPMALTGKSDRLDPVVAAGFPAFVIHTDPEFVAAFEGGNLDRLNSVQMAVTEGVVTQKHHGAAGISVIGHTAMTSPGNSGGPLVDKCGRVVGVNTFVRTDAENALRLNLALGADDAAAFLAGNGVTALVADTVCIEAPPAPAPPSAPVPEAAVAPPPAGPAEGPADIPAGAPAVSQPLQVQPERPPSVPSPAVAPQILQPGRDAEADQLRPLPEAGQ